MVIAFEVVVGGILRDGEPQVALVGFGGMVSFGHGLFYGLGA